MSEETTIKPNTPEELTDILLVLDKEKKKIQAVKKLDEKGNMETVDPNKKNLGDFLRVDGSGNIFSNFFKNFFSELKNPTNFSFFKVPEPKAIEAAKELQKQAKNPTPEGEKLMHQYELKADMPKEQEKTVPEQANPQAATQEPTNQQSENPAALNQQSEPSKGEYKYNVDDIDWDTMNNLGLSQAYLEKKNLLDTLLKGFKSNVLVPVSLNLDGVVFRSDARIWLQPGEDGKIITALQGVRKEPNLSNEFFGHSFSQADKKNLLETGNMGRVVNLINSKTGESIPSIVSLDKLTNELVAYRTANIKIPDEFKGVKLNEEQKQTLMEGKAVFLKDMVSLKGNTFSSNVQFSADRKFIEPIFEKGKSQDQKPDQKPDQKLHDIPTEFRKQKLTEEQRDKLEKNEPAFISLIDKKNKPYQGYITFNRQTNKTKFSWPNQMEGKVIPAEAHKTQVAVNSDGKTNESTKKIDEPHNPQQNNPKNKEQQDQQNKPKQSNGPKR